jgi:NAD(P)-dependent dehydrogenase (short-subunit alcohol dehydrogenase family)
MSASEFAGLTAVATGGASGIGLAAARLLATRGARVTWLDLKPDDVPAPLVGIPADVTVRAVVEEAARRFGDIDILVNNAGIGAQGTIEAEDHTDDEWRRVFEGNVFGVVRVTRAALPYLRRSRSAAIVNTCSIAAIAGLLDRSLYSSTKAGVLSLTRASAADFVHSAILVTCVHPGAADAPWIGRLLDRAAGPEAERAALDARRLMGRLVAAVAHLASRPPVPPPVLISPWTAVCTD